MTAEKLNDVLMLISDLYPGRAPAITERVIDVWMKCFKPYEDDIVEQAVMSAVKECKYPPTINDLIGFCDHYKKKYDGIIADIKLVYREITDLCRREDRNEDTWNAYRECIKDSDLSISRKKAMILNERFWNMYHDQNGELPPLEEWFQIQTFENRSE